MTRTDEMVFRVNSRGKPGVTVVEIEIIGGNREARYEYKDFLVQLISTLLERMHQGMLEEGVEALLTALSNPRSER